MIFTDRSKALLLLWIPFVIFFLSCLYSLQPCGHLLGKGLPPCSFACDVFLCFFHFPIWCPGPGMLVDCIIPELCLLTTFVVTFCLNLKVRVLFVIGLI